MDFKIVIGIVVLVKRYVSVGSMVSVFMAAIFSLLPPFTEIILMHLQIQTSIIC